MKTLKLISIISAAIILASCDVANKEPIKGSVDRTAKPIITTVYFYDTEEEVQKKYREIHKLPNSHKTLQQGFSRWREYRDANGNTIENPNEPLTCEIHTVRPSRIDDNATLTLGHEMLHCVIGTYHAEIAN